MTNKDSIKRADELKSYTTEYIHAKQSIPSGLDEEVMRVNLMLKTRIMTYFNASEEDWNDYLWQLKHSIKSVEVLGELLELSMEELREVQKIEEKYRWKISPYYLSLMTEDRLNPIRLQALPTLLELDEHGLLDPMDEEHTNPAGSITRRYPDRLIINVTNMCAMYCRHCQRRRKIGGSDQHQSIERITESIQYIKDNPEIRDVLITGGDPLMMSDHKLEIILKELKEIPHVEMIRIGTRTLVTMPQRITTELAEMLSKYHPLYINTHFNSPLEITPEVKEACDKLSKAGIPLGNQAVLLNGINNDKFVMERLNHLLLMCRIRPYYIFHAKNVKGTKHFNTSIDDGMEIMEYLRGRTSGMAIPTYIVNAPKGNGKIPMLPEYSKRNGNTYTVRTWENKTYEYDNTPTKELGKLL